MISHTPGPWEFVPKLTASENHRGYFVRAEKTTQTGMWALADVQPGDEDGKLGEANARLIAAAPELLAALRLIKHATSPELDDGGEHEAAYELACAAIAKATGAAP